MAVGDFYPDTCRTGGRVDDRIDKRDPARIGLAGKSLQGEMNLVASVQERQVNFESVEHRPYARQVRYVEQDTSTPTFLMREVELGPSLGNAYVILKGLSEGEEVVTNGVFSIDASAQLEGKQSMMNAIRPV